MDQLTVRLLELKLQIVLELYTVVRVSEMLAMDPIQVKINILIFLEFLLFGA